MLVFIQDLHPIDYVHARRTKKNPLNHKGKGGFFDNLNENVHFSFRYDIGSK